MGSSSNKRLARSYTDFKFRQLSDISANAEDDCSILTSGSSVITILAAAEGLSSENRKSSSSSSCLDAGSLVDSSKSDVSLSFCAQSPSLLALPVREPEKPISKPPGLFTFRLASRSIKSSKVDPESASTTRSKGSTVFTSLAHFLGAGRRESVLISPSRSQESPGPSSRKARVSRSSGILAAFTSRRTSRSTTEPRLNVVVPQPRSASDSAALVIQNPNAPTSLTRSNENIELTGSTGRPKYLKKMSTYQTQNITLDLSLMSRNDGQESGLNPSCSTSATSPYGLGIFDTNAGAPLCEPASQSTSSSCKTPRNTENIPPLVRQRSRSIFQGLPGLEDIITVTVSAADETEIAEPENYNPTSANGSQFKSSCDENCGTDLKQDRSNHGMDLSRTDGGPDEAAHERQVRWCIGNNPGNVVTSKRILKSKNNLLDQAENLRVVQSSRQRKFNIITRPLSPQLTSQSTPRQRYCPSVVCERPLSQRRLVSLKSRPSYNNGSSIEMISEAEQGRWEVSEDQKGRCEVSEKGRCEISEKGRVEISEERCEICEKLKFHRDNSGGFPLKRFDPGESGLVSADKLISDLGKLNLSADDSCSNIPKSEPKACCQEMLCSEMHECYFAAQMPLPYAKCVAETVRVTEASDYSDQDLDRSVTPETSRVDEVSSALWPSKSPLSGKSRSSASESGTTTSAGGNTGVVAVMLHKRLTTIDSESAIFSPRTAVMISGTSSVISSSGPCLRPSVGGVRWPMFRCGDICLRSLDGVKWSDESIRDVERKLADFEAYFISDRLTAYRDRQNMVRSFGHMLDLMVTAPCGTFSRNSSTGVYTISRITEFYHLGPVISSGRQGNVRLCLPLHIAAYYMQQGGTEENIWHQTVDGEVARRGLPVAAEPPFLVKTCVKSLWNPDEFVSLTSFINECINQLPQSLRVFFIYQDDWNYFFVMERPSISLCDVLCGDITESDVKAIIYQLVHVLKCLKTQKVVHRDLRLDHIVFKKKSPNCGRRGQRQTTGLDLCRPVVENLTPNYFAPLNWSRASSSVVFKSGSLCSQTTSLFMDSHELAVSDWNLTGHVNVVRELSTDGLCYYQAPELYLTRSGPHLYSSASDMWAVGQMMAYLVTGKFPFYPLGVRPNISAIKPETVFDSHGFLLRPHHYWQIGVHDRRKNPLICEDIVLKSLEHDPDLSDRCPEVLEPILVHNKQLRLPRDWKSRAESFIVYYVNDLEDLFVRILTENPNFQIAAELLIQMLTVDPKLRIGPEVASNHAFLDCSTILKHTIMINEMVKSRWKSNASARQQDNKFHQRLGFSEFNLPFAACIQGFKRRVRHSSGSSSESLLAELEASEQEVASIVASPVKKPSRRGSLLFNAVANSIKVLLGTDSTGNENSTGRRNSTTSPQHNSDRRHSVASTAWGVGGMVENSAATSHGGVAQLAEFLEVRKRMKDLNAKLLVEEDSGGFVPSPATRTSCRESRQSDLITDQRRESRDGWPPPKSPSNLCVASFRRRSAGAECQIITKRPPNTCEVLVGSDQVAGFGMLDEDTQTYDGILIDAGSQTRECSLEKIHRGTQTIFEEPKLSCGTTD